MQLYDLALVMYCICLSLKKPEPMWGHATTVCACMQNTCYVADVPGADFDHHWNEVADAAGQVNRPGHRICMDESRRNCDFVCSFAASFPNVDRAYDRHSIKEYLAVQIVRERKERWQKPKVIGLVLDSVPEFGEGAFRRVGLTDFDEPLAYGWVRYTLGLV